jgi:hypothetical protein
MVDCGPDQGRSEVETTGVAALRRGFQPSENTELGRKMPLMDGHELTVQQPLYPIEATPTNRPGIGLRLFEQIELPCL